MTNQSELEHVMGQCKCDTFMPCWYWNTVKRIAETTDKTSLRDIVLMREQYDYITANYTPNSEIEQRERETRVDELRRIENANKNNGINFWFEDYPTNNGWATMMQYTQWRIAELDKADKST